MTAAATTGPGGPAPLLALAHAAAAGVRARIAYREAGGEVRRREVEVLALGWRWGTWALLAHCHRRGALRIFLLDRIVEARTGRRRARPHLPESAEAAEFALADLQPPGIGPAVRLSLDVPVALVGVASVLFPGAPLEVGPGGRRVHLLVTDPAACRAMAASLGLALG